MSRPIMCDHCGTQTYIEEAASSTQDVWANIASRTLAKEELASADLCPDCVQLLKDQFPKLMQVLDIP